MKTAVHLLDEKSKEAPAFLDLDLHIRRFTPAVTRIYNFILADIGRSISHFVSNLEEDQLVKNIQQVLCTPVPKAIETQTKDGWMMEVWATITAIVDDENHPAAVATTERDITNHHKARPESQEK